MWYSVITQRKKTPLLDEEKWFPNLTLEVIKATLVIIMSVFLGHQVSAQETIADVLKNYNAQSVPYISVQELATTKTEAIILDAREKKEFEVSHIKEAIHVGYDNFNLEATLNSITNKDQTIVVYCTLGIRSEDIAELLKSAGCTNVLNLYGGIVEWKNNNFKVFNNNNKETEKVHVFDVYWSQWLTKGTKVFD